MRNTSHPLIAKLLSLLLAGLLVLAPVFAAAEESPVSERPASEDPADWLASPGLEIPLTPDPTPAPEPVPDLADDLEPAVPTPLPSQEPEGPLPEAGPSPEPEAEADPLDAPTLPLEAQGESNLLRTGGHEPYLKGYSDGTFRPNVMMTRAEAAQMFYALLREPVQAELPAFSDVRANAWYVKAVSALTQLGVLRGYPDGTFRPNDTITRAAFVTMVNRCFTLAPGACSFTDVRPGSWAYDAIAAATTAGWIEGVGNGAFQPSRSIKRSEAVAVMNRALGRTGEGFAADRATQKFLDVPSTHWAYLHITEAAQPDVIVTPTPTPTPAPTTAPTPVSGFAPGDSVSVTATSGLNLRSSPSTASSTNILQTLNNGTLLTVLSVAGEWLEVSVTNSGRTGYVFAEYVAKYTPGAASGASLSASTLTLHQYQSARLDASITSGKLSSMVWTSSAPGVASLGYVVEMGSERTYAAMIYARSPGTATLTFADAAGTTRATCTVTVQAAEPIRFAYSSENCATAGRAFDLIAVTDPGQTQVTFSTGGQTYPTELYTTESRISDYGLPTNTNRVFRRSVTFSAPGTYTVTASAGGGSKRFSVLVLPAGGDALTTSADARMTSTRELQLIAAYEGALPEVEDDNIAWGNPTVGYGYVVRRNEAFYNNLTSSELFGMLVDKVNSGSFGNAVNNFRSKFGLLMSQCQFDALVSFVYNLGAGWLDPTEYDLPQVILNAVAPPAGLSEQSPVTGTLNIESDHLYASPSVGARTVANVPYRSSISVIGVQVFPDTHQVWYRAKYNNQTGYIPAGLVQLQASGLSRDLNYADATILANHFLQVCHSGSTVYPGLVYRRLAESKVFFFADYDQADPHRDWDLYRHNTYGFLYPDDAKQYER